MITGSYASASINLSRHVTRKLLKSCHNHFHSTPPLTAIAFFAFIVSTSEIRSPCDTSHIRLIHRIHLHRSYSDRLILTYWCGFIHLNNKPQHSIHAAGSFSLLETPTKPKRSLNNCRRKSTTAYNRYELSIFMHNKYNK